jgi:hypothetical protein
MGRPLSYFVDETAEAPAAATPDVVDRVDRLEQSLARVEEKLDALLDRLPQ